MSRRPKQVTAIAWYSPEQWKLLKRTAVDAHLLDDTYEEWHKNASGLIARLKNDKMKFVKCFVEVAEVEQWCREQGLPLDGAARSRFVAEAVQTRHEQDSGK